VEGTLKFNLPEENKEFELASNAGLLLNIIKATREKFINIMNGEQPIEERRLAEKVVAEINAEISGWSAWALFE
jgi:hypothetical protein